MAVIKSRVKETTTTIGTSSYVLLGASTGFQSFSVIGNGNTTCYCCFDGTNFEVGLGTYTLSGTTLSRDTVLRSSNSDAAVNWGVGTKTVIVIEAPERETNTYSDTTLASNASVTITHASDSEFLREPYALVNLFDSSLLLHSNGSNGSTSIIDSSTVANTITANGNAQISTSQSKFGGSSAYFDGTGDYFSLSNTSNFNITSGDFTIAFFVYINANSTANNDGNKAATIISCNYPTSGGISNAWAVNLDGNTSTTGTGIRIEWYNGSSNGPGYSSVSVSQGVWHHIELTRSSGTLRIFLDGVSQSVTAGGTGTSFTSGTSNNVRIGTMIYGGYQHYLNGYIDELLVIKGTALHTSNFTPPLEPYVSSVLCPIKIGSPTPSTQDSDRVWVRYDDGAMANTATKTTFTNKTGQSITGRFGVRIKGL